MSQDMIEQAEAFFTPDSTVTLAGKPVELNERALSKPKKLLAGILTSAVMAGTLSVQDAEARSPSFQDSLLDVAKSIVVRNVSDRAPRDYRYETRSLTRDLTEGFTAERERETLNANQYNVELVSQANPERAWVAPRDGVTNVAGRQFHVERGDAILLDPQRGPQLIPADRFEQQYVRSESSPRDELGFYVQSNEVLYAREMRDDFAASNGDYGRDGDYLLQRLDGSQFVVERHEFGNRFMVYDKRNFNPAAAMSAGRDLDDDFGFDTPEYVR